MYRVALEINEMCLANLLFTVNTSEQQYWILNICGITSQILIHENVIGVVFWGSFLCCLN